MEELEKRPAPGYAEFYSITNDGKVISEERIVENVRKGKTGTTMRIKERVLKPSPDNDGYMKVVLCKDGKCTSVPIHKLVANTFLEPPLDGQTQIRHKDGNPANNHKDNLEWGTPSQNAHDRTKHGTMHNGEKSCRAKLTNEQVLEIRKRASEGEKIAVINKDYDVAYGTITKIIYRQRWTHL